MMTAENKGVLLGTIGVVTFALTLPATRHLVAYMDPVFIGVGRAFFASILAILILIITRQPWPTRSQIAQLFIVFLGVVVGFPVLSAIAMQTLPAAHGGVILAILPLATVAMSVLVSTERPSLGFWLVSILGTVLVIIYSILNSGDGASAGLPDVLLLLAVLSAAAGYAVGGKLAHEVGGWQVICWALAVGFPFLLYPALFGLPFSSSQPELRIATNWQLGLKQIPLDALGSFVYLTVMSQLIGFFFWYKGLALGGVARVSQLQLLQPFVTIAASALLLNELISGLTLWFAALVVVVVAIGKRMSISR